MSRKIASKAGLVGLVLIGGAAVLSACSSSDDSAGTPTGSAGNGAAGKAGGTAGTTGNGTGGTNSGAAGTTGNGTAGTTGNGTAGTTGTAGSGGAASGPFACAGVAANCNSWTDFPQSTTNSWGNGTFVGGITIFGTGITRDPAVTDGIHVTGMVTGYGAGFGLYFSTCADLSKYTGISFKVKGTTNADGIALEVQSNDDSPWQPRPQDMKGACTAPDPANAYNVCLPPKKSAPVTTTETTVTVAWADLTGGMPTVGTDGKQVIGMQWALPWSDTATAYSADVTVSDVVLTGGTDTISCATGAGAGGTGGSGGTSAGGSAGAGTAGSGTAGGGTGGTSANP